MRFNQIAPNLTKTVNLAGGEAYKMDAKLELVSILLTSFVQDQYYRQVGDTKAPKDDTLLGKVTALLERVDPLFAAKAAVFARNEYGMRSISHVVAGEMVRRARGQEWLKDFYRAVVRRPDDMLEIAAYYAGKYGLHPFPNAMKKGFAGAFAKFDSYQLAKYRGEDKAIKLIDLVNLVRPKPNRKNSAALLGLVKGELRNTTTWETKLSKAGEVAENAEEKQELKGQAWKELISTRKLGYMALLKNLRNIMEQADDETFDGALAQLVDLNLIQGSLVLPFRYTTAIEEIEKTRHARASRTMAAISQAVGLACQNVPRFGGKTLVAVDCSGSMQGRVSDIASLFAAVLVKSGNDVDVVQFNSVARYLALNPADSITTLKKMLTLATGGTSFHSIFEEATKSGRKYARIIILSDMQAWMEYSVPTSSLNKYKMVAGADPLIFSWDLAGHGSLQFPEKRVCALAGFSEKVFDLMKILEEDREALVHKVEQVVL
jgi:60 kDa SS-A/Ro ribonucleoprotein